MAGGRLGLSARDHATAGGNLLHRIVPGDSFEEAFEDAIEQLPPLYPDELQQFVVTQTGALVGGIDGLHELYVTVQV